jgi:hypothetical protein
MNIDHVVTATHLTFSSNPFHSCSRVITGETPDGLTGAVAAAKMIVIMVVKVDIYNLVVI